MGTIQELLDRLWKDYAAKNPQAGAIHKLLRDRGETVVNDHIALRTYDDPRIDIDVLARAFAERGYQPKDEYTFPDKKLYARHYEAPGTPAGQPLPKVFISQLQLEHFSEPFRNTVASLVDQVPASLTQRWDFVVSGRPWRVSYSQYESLLVESEYAAWLAAWGFCANHFTVDVGQLKTFRSLAEFNGFIEANGFKLNASGGKIKGSSRDFLEQSSTLAAEATVDFTDGPRSIPCCYYEFAKRYRTPDGQLFQGFVAKSADKIFESTNRR